MSECFKCGQVGQADGGIGCVCHEGPGIPGGIKRDMSTPENRAFWKSVSKTASEPDLRTLLAAKERRIQELEETLRVIRDLVSRHSTNYAARVFDLTSDALSTPEGDL